MSGATDAADGASAEDPDSSLPSLADALECAVCTALMVDPVVTADGHSYCRACILEWFETCDARIDRRLQQGQDPGSEDDALLAPATLLPLGSRALLQNTALRQAIEAYATARPALVRREQQRLALEVLAAGTSAFGTSQSDPDHENWVEPQMIFIGRRPIILR